MARNGSRPDLSHILKGNKFWQIRAKHGRDRLFKTPELLAEAAAEYFQWCEENPEYESVVQKIKVDKFREEIKLVPNPKRRPYTLSGLCLYLDVNTAYFNDFERSLKEQEKTQINKDFSTVITRIREAIYTQKFEGAASGFFNANIIARDLGLVDKKELDNTHSGKIIIKGQKFAEKDKDEDAT